MEQVTFTVADPGSAEARWAMLRYFDELASRFEGGFVAGDALDDAAVADLIPPPHVRVPSRRVRSAGGRWG